MVSAELKHDKYLVRFKGKKQQFTEYINKIMSIPDKVWDMQNRCWSIPKDKIYQLNDKFDNVEFLEEVVDIFKSDTKDYENMGKDMKLPPYDYQKECIKFGLDTNSALFVLPCGSGKTPIGIGLYLEAKDRNIVQGPGLIVVKASLKLQWKKEIEKFSDLNANIIKSKADITYNIKERIKTRKRNIKKKVTEEEKADLAEQIVNLEAEGDQLFKDQFCGYDLLIANYEALTDDDIKRELHRIRPDFVMCDEIHYIKSSETKRSRAVYEFKTAKMRVGATATPIMKNAEDIFGLFSFVDPLMFPNKSNFGRLYIKYAGYGRPIGIKNKDHLQKKIQPRMIVKTKEEISKQLPTLMPPIQRYCDLTSEQQEVNERIMEELDNLKEQEMAIRNRCKSEAEARSNQELLKLDAVIMALQTFAQELTDAPELLLQSDSEMARDYYIPSANPKLDMLEELVEEILDSDEKVTIFSRYERMQSIIKDRLQKLDKNMKFAIVNGKIKGEKRYDEVYNKFRDKEEYKILLMTDAGAEGLNLSHCKYIIEYDLADSYAIQTQRHGRIERADSIHNTVFVYQLIANDSWDTIQQKIVSKKESYDAEIVKSLAKGGQL